MHTERLVAVTGATGRQGGAVCRALLARGWRVRALTRDPGGPRAAALAALGADVLAADMDDAASLDAAFAGVRGVYSVQNPMISGLVSEVRQGRAVADAAQRAGVELLVYGSAGPGDRGTGVGSWETKLDVEDHLRGLDLPTTVLSPMAFMELMTDPAFYPAAGTWHLWPKLTGADVAIPWLSCADLGVIAATAFADPPRFVGRRLNLAGDRRSLRECRRIYTETMGRPPARIPMPVWLFRRFAGDAVALWCWLRIGDPHADVELTRAVHPGAHAVDSWLREQAAGRTSRRMRGAWPHRTPAGR